MNTNRIQVVETMQDSRMTIQAQLALHAASNRNNRGRWATMRFCLNQGIDARLYRLACILLAGEKVVELKPDLA